MLKKIKYGTILLASVMMLTMPTMNVYASSITELKEEIDNDKSDYETILNTIQELENTIEEQKDKLLELSIKLDAMEEERIEKYESMKLRIQYLYENSDNSMVTAFTNAKKISTVINQTSMTKEIYDYDRKKLEEYAELVENMKNDQETLENGIKEIEQSKEKLDDTKQKLEEKINSNEKLLKEKEEEEKEEAAKKMVPTGTVQRVDNSYEYCQEDLELIYAIVMQEAGNNYDGALAVITCACNRAESSKWGYLGNDPLSQLTAKGQFAYSIDTYWKKYMGNNVPQNVRDAVSDALQGERSHQFLSFRGYVVNGGVNIGGNYYFSPME